MTRESDFAEGFWCCKCGSTTAIKIGNSRFIRCMGCLTLFAEGEKWEAHNHPTIHPIADEPPPAKQD